MRFIKFALVAGMGVPVLYFGTLLLSSLFYPGYSHVTQYASELGSAAAPYPSLFNTGIILTGLAAMLAGLGFWLGLRGQTGNGLLPALCALCLVLFGISFVMGGTFPMPDERHGAFGIGLGVHVAPLLLAFALWKQQRLRALNIYLIVTALVMLTLFAIMMGVGGMVTRANVGLWQRTYAFFMLTWIGIASLYLNRHLDPSRAGERVAPAETAVQHRPM